LRQAPKLASSLKAPRTVWPRPLPRRPAKSMLSIGMPCFGTISPSMPWAVPSQDTSQPRARIVLRDRDAGEDVAAGAGRHDHQFLAFSIIHWRPPRMRTRFS
jgi:hypothetical protein